MIVRLSLCAAAISFAASGTSLAQDSIRSQAVVNLTFDEPGGAALDSASKGNVPDHATLSNGAVRIRSPFWGQTGKQAVVLDAAANQFIQIPDSPDVDRPNAVTFALLCANLHPANDAGARGLVGKRVDQGATVTNYGINYVMQNDLLQVYLNDTTGFKIAQYNAKVALGSRKPVYLAAVFQVGDAPEPDADADADDMLVRFSVNGMPFKPRNVVGGIVLNNFDAWLIDVKVGSLLNDVPLTIGASGPNFEPASVIVDEFTMFDRALSNEEVKALFVETIGPNTSTELPKDGPDLREGPEIASLSLNGLQAGRTTTLTITGSDLLPEPKLVLPVPIASQTVKPNPQANRIEVEISLAADVPPGHYPLRVQTPQGVSRALPIAIDRLPQQPAVPTSPDKPVTLPVAISGTVSGQQQVRIHFAGKAGQRLVADVECRRLGAGMSPVLELRNPKGTPVSIAWGQSQFRGDARIVATLPVDGIYTVDFHDLAYNAPGNNPFRLKLGDLKLADVAFPPVVAAGTEQPVELIGTGLSGMPPIPFDAKSLPLGLSRLVNVANVDSAPLPVARVATSVEVVEAATPAGGRQTIDAQFATNPHVPVVVSGRITQPTEADQYLLNVKPGLRLSLAVDTATMSSPLVPQINLLSPANGTLLLSSDDRTNVDYAPPEGVSQVVAQVLDLNGRGGPYHLYRLRIIPSGQPNFTLSLESNRLNVTRDGSSVVRIDVTRQGYYGPIDLKLNAPAGFVLDPPQIPSDATKAFVNVLASGLPDGLHRIEIRGESVGLMPPLVRVAQLPPDGRLQLIPEAASELAAVVGGSAGISLELGTLPTAVFKGADFSLPVSLKAQNPEAAKAVARITLLTTEAPRQADANDPKKGQRPLVRGLPEQTLAVGDAAGSLRVAVPLDIAEPRLACVVRADLVVHAFSDKVLASVYSRPFSLEVKPAGTLQLAGGTLMLKGSATTKFAGTLNRTAGFIDPVTVSLVNLPAGYSATPATIAADQSAFEISVTAPAVAAAADIPNIVVRVTAAGGSPLLGDTPLPTKAAP